MGVLVPGPEVVSTEKKKEPLFPVQKALSIEKEIEPTSVPDSGRYGYRASDGAFSSGSEIVAGEQE